MKKRSPTSPVLRWPTEGSRRWVEEYLRRASLNSDILAVVAIGSAVRPGVESSDLDLLVVTDGEPRPVRAPVEVDVRQYRAATLEHRLSTGHDLIGWAVLYGELLQEEGDFWTAFVDRHRQRVPLPSAETARKRAARVERDLGTVLSFGDRDAAAEQLITLLTHLGRAALIDRGVYPASRPELPAQLREAGEQALADALQHALKGKRSPAKIYQDFHSLGV